MLFCFEEFVKSITLSYKNNGVPPSKCHFLFFNISVLRSFEIVNEPTPQNLHFDHACSTICFQKSPVVDI